MKRTPLKQYSSLKSYTKLETRAQPFNQNISFRGGKVGLKRSSHRMKSRTNDDLGKADSMFSKIIIARDGKCLKCGTTIMLSCSHFYGRANYATRFDKENCITLCLLCHELWESKKKTDYKDFMVEWLGFEAFCALEKRSKVRISPKESIKEALKWMVLVLPSNEIQY